MAIKVMTFNTQHCMNHLTGVIDFDIMADAIRKCGGEIVGLNEMRGRGRDYPDYDDQCDILGKMLGYGSFFGEAIKFGGVNPYGNGLLSKYPILSAEVIPVPDPAERKYKGYYETRCLVKAVVDAPGFPGGLTVCAIHFGLNPDEHENAVATVLKAIEPERCVLMGDFNVKPDNPLLDPIKEKMNDVSPFIKGPALSFVSENPTVKIDYIFVSPDIKVSEAEIPAIVASDHRPHTAIIELA